MPVLETSKSKLYLKALQLKPVVVILVGILVSTFLIIMLILPSHKAINDALIVSVKAQKAVLRTLDGIDSRLNQLSQQVNKTAPVSPNPQLAAMDDHLNTIEHYLNKINPQNNLQQLQVSLNHSNDVFLKKVNTMQLQIQHLKQRLTPQSFLAVSELPFKVTSIDIWNGLPQATIQLDNEVALMAQGDTRSGWTLTTISFEPGRVIFKNAQNQFVKIELC